MSCFCHNKNLEKKKKSMNSRRTECSLKKALLQEFEMLVVNIFQLQTTRKHYAAELVCNDQFSCFQKMYIFSR